MYSDVFCKVYNEFGWNYYPEIFGEQLLKWLERKLLGGELLARIVFAGKKVFKMGFPPGQRGSAEHAERLVSVPWKPEQEKIGLKAGRVIRASE